MRAPLTAIALAALAATAIPCCVISGTEQVAMSDQNNIIIWDADAKTQHFIRNAQFRTQESNFSFVAPSPVVPNLESVDESVFLTIENHIASETAVSNRDKEPMAGEESAAASVEVLQEKQVGNFLATTLKANDGQAIADWLKENNYQTTPDTASWLDFYAKKGWVLTAFKLNRAANYNPETNLYTTGAIRMSFKTERPFNPFFVPATNLDPATRSSLRLHFISLERHRATLENELWREPTSVVRLNAFVADQLTRKLKLPFTAIPQSALVSTYSSAFPVPAKDDIYFLPLGTATITPPSPTAQGNPAIAFGLGAVALALGAVAASRFRRKTNPSG
jgi:hypothetical protein